MKSIWKYPFFGAPGDSIILKMPKGAQIVRFDMQDSTPTVWALVDPHQPMADRRFRVVGTGWDFDEEVGYLGTVFDGPYVWHGLELL